MTPQERQLVDDLFDRLSGLENTPRDPEAAAAVVQGLRRAPNAAYALVQTALVQDEALKRANARIQELEGRSPDQPPSAGFLDTMRDALFGQSQQRGSVPSVRPPEPAGRAAWNTGQAMQQTQPQGQYGQGQYQAPYNQPYGAPQGPFGGGGSSFLGTAAATVAGVVGGGLLMSSIRSMMGGGHQSFGDGSNLGGNSGEGRSPWASDQSGSALARDAGVNDIGSSGQHADSSRSGIFDQASNDVDHDDMDMDSDSMDSGGGGGGDSDFA